MLGKNTSKALGKKIGAIAALIFLPVAHGVCGGNPPSESGQAAAIARRIADITQRIQSEDGVMRSQAIQALEELAATQTLDKKTLPQLRQLEKMLLDSVRRHIVSVKKTDRQKAFHQIVMLGDLRAPKSIPLLVKHLEFRNPYETTYQTGPLSYEQPKPKDLPVFDALLKIGPEAIKPVFHRAISTDQPLIHEVAAELLIYHHQFQGACVWLDKARQEGELTPEQRSRMVKIRQLVEARR